jgi:hypothetical protein
MSNRYVGYRNKASHGSVFLDPRGHSTYGIALCGRCSRKFFLDELHMDPNSPGLMVCIADLDVLDPYRLPARQTENITLPFIRPDTPLDDGVPDNFTPEV